MRLLAIDLAEKCSAAVGTSDNDEAELHQTFCQDRHMKLFAEWLNGTLHLFKPTHVICEDVPFGFKGSPTYKPVVKKQGVVELLTEHHRVKLVYILPTPWQRGLGYRDKARDGTTKAWAKKVCIERGFEARIIREAHGSKALEDLRDAYLIGVYGRFNTSLWL